MSQGFYNGNNDVPKLGRAIDAPKPKPPGKWKRRWRAVWSDFQSNGLPQAVGLMAAFVAISIPLFTIIAGIEAVIWHIPFRIAINPLTHPWLLTIWVQLLLGIFGACWIPAIESASLRWDKDQEFF